MNSDSYSPTDRRPIAARNLKIVEALATRLADSRLNANQISVLGMVAALCSGIAFWSTQSLDSLRPVAWIFGALFVQARLMANLLDGMVALKQGTASPVGELYNEVPDRVSDTLILVGFGYAYGSSPELGYLAAVCAMSTAYVRALGKTLIGAQDFCGPMAKQQRMFTVTIIALLCAFLSSLAEAPVYALWIIAIGSVATSVRRLRHISVGLRK